MANERILKRLRRWSNNNDASSADYEEYKRSVLEDLTQLYNTQKGTVLIDNELGVSDFSGMMSRFGDQEASQIERSLREVTDKYEPRIRGVAVRHSNSDQHNVLRFMVTCALTYKNQILPIEFAALVEGNGSVTLEI